MATGPMPPAYPALNRASLQARGLAHWYPMVPGHAKRRDFVNGVNFNGTTGTEPVDVAGRFGRAVEFGPGGAEGFWKEAGTFVLSPNVDLANTGITVSFWVYLFATAFDTPFSIGDGTSGNRFQIYDNASSSPSYIIQNASGSRSSSGGTITYNKWEHWAVALTEGSTQTRQLFFNGALVKENTGGGDKTPAGLTYCAIGGIQHALNGAIHGYLKDLRIYDRPLAPAAISAMYSPATRWDMWWKRSRSYFLLAAGGGDTFNLTASDTLSFADASSETAAFSTVSSESLDLSDTSSETAAFSVSTSEALNLSDASSELADFVETLAEALNLADTAGGTTAMSKAVTEALNLSDSASETATFAANIAESLSLLDTATRTAIINRGLAETLSLVDTATGTTGIAAEVAESLALSDVSSEIATFLRSVSEVLSLTDTAAKSSWTGTRVATDSLSFIDSASAVGGEAVSTTKGGLSLSEKRMRELEKLQMLQRDDDEIIALITRLLR